MLSLLQSALRAGGNSTPGGQPGAGAAAADTVLVTGHAVFLNAVALGLAVALRAHEAGKRASFVQQLLDLDLGEAQGIELVIDHTDRVGPCLASISHKRCAGS